MKILSKAIALLFLAVFAVNAQDYQESIWDSPEPVIPEEPLVFQDPQRHQTFKHPHMRTSVYLHPVALLAGLNVNVPLVYITVEHPFSLYNALIVKPSVWASGEGYRIGGDLGIRHYLAGRGDGMYLALQAGGFYLSIDDIEIDINFDLEEEAEKKRNKNKSVWFDGMGYFGYSYKYAHISIYSDTGIGYGCVAGNCSLIYDLNFGVGLPF